MVVATEVHCAYVQRVHLHSLSIQGVDQAAIEVATRGDFSAPEISKTARGAIEFAHLAARTRSSYDAADETAWLDLRRHTAEALAATGLDDEECFELTATVALFEQICTVANVLDLDPNQP